MNLSLGTVIFYVPVQEKYLSRWEYYRVDQRMLEASFEKVVVASSVKHFLRALVSEKPDLVYFWWWHSSALIVLLSRFFGVLCVGTGAVHMYDESGAKDFFTKSWMFRLANRFTWRLADATLFISKSQLRQITSHEKVRNPVFLKSSTFQTVSELDQTTAPENRDARTVNLMTVCWLTKDQIIRKSVYTLLNAIANLPPKIQDETHLTIVGGEGDGVDELKDWLETTGLSANVSLLVDADNETKIEAYKVSDLYFQPSTYEGFGNSVLEAMTYGTPAIVSGLTAQPEVVKDSGFVLREINAECIAQTISEVHAMTAAQRQQLREKTLSVVRSEHSFDRRLSEFKAVMKELFSCAE